MSNQIAVSFDCMDDLRTKLNRLAGELDSASDSIGGIRLRSSSLIRLRMSRVSAPRLSSTLAHARVTHGNLNATLASYRSALSKYGDAVQRLSNNIRRAEELFAENEDALLAAFNGTSIGDDGANAEGSPFGSLIHDIRKIFEFMDWGWAILEPLIKWFFKMPRFEAIGKYVHVFDSAFFKGGNGLARWYTESIIKAGNLYPKASGLFRLDGVMSKISNAMPYIGGALAAADEWMNSDPSLPQSQRIANTIVEGVYAIGISMASAAIVAELGLGGGAVGNVPGALAGAAIGIGAGMAMTWLTEADFIFGKSVKDYAKEWLGKTIEYAISGAKALTAYSAPGDMTITDAVGPCGVQGSGALVGFA